MNLNIDSDTLCKFLMLRFSFQSYFIALAFSISQDAASFLRHWWSRKSLVGLQLIINLQSQLRLELSCFWVTTFEIKVLLASNSKRVKLKCNRNDGHEHKHSKISFLRYQVNSLAFQRERNGRQKLDFFPNFFCS